MDRNRDLLTRFLLDDLEAVVAHVGGIQGGVVRKAHSRKAAHGEDVAYNFVHGVAKVVEGQKLEDFGLGEVDAVGLFAARIKLQFHEAICSYLFMVDGVLQDLTQIHHQLGVGIHSQVQIQDDEIAQSVDKALAEVRKLDGMANLFFELFHGLARGHVGPNAGKLDSLAFGAEALP